MTDSVLRIHPAIGFARVGNSQDYYLAPESSAGLDQEGSEIYGGLPIKKGTENDPISEKDLRDAQGALKRQGQRFRIYRYDDAQAAGSYPYQGKVTEITIGSEVDGKTVADIVWTVHLANKKANCWKEGSLEQYADGRTPDLRNASFAGTDKPEDPRRLEKLVIDAGPRAIRGANAERISFDTGSEPTCYLEGSGVTKLPSYPVSYPAQEFTRLSSPSGTEVSQLGAIETDAQGRLIVIGGEGTASGWYQNENGDGSLDLDPFPLDDDVDNDGWFDDTADGPVKATLVFTDGSTHTLASTAWAVSTDPGYAPQVRNVVSLWDDVYDTWVTRLGLDPSIFDGPPTYDAPADYPQSDKHFQKTYQPSFPDDIYPIFRAARLQMFSTGLNELGRGSHRRLDSLSADDDPTRYLNVKTFIRDPYTAKDQPQTGAPQMPLALGDHGATFLVLTKTQYFFLNQWYAKQYTGQPRPLSPGEQLDKDVLTNCLGGRFSPGIDMTFIVRDTAFYDPDWHDPSTGPFRPHARKLDYSPFAQPGGGNGKPFLTVGYIPERENTRVEPGDICKFMAIPWHTDYNSCATHVPAENPPDPPKTNLTNPDQVFTDINTTLFWSWPAQRPVSVYLYADLVANQGRLPAQRFSVRGRGTQAIPGPDNGVWPVKEGTKPPEGAGPDGSFFDIQQVGRFQDREEFIRHWQEIGTVIQGRAITGYDPSWDEEDGVLLLEVQSQMSNVSDIVQEWPNNLPDKVVKTE